MMGGMNAKIGPNNEGLEHVMGRHGIGYVNENGELLSELRVSGCKWVMHIEHIYGLLYYF